MPATTGMNNMQKIHVTINNDCAAYDDRMSETEFAPHLATIRAEVERRLTAEYPGVVINVDTGIESKIFVSDDLEQENSEIRSEVGYIIEQVYNDWCQSAGAFAKA
jgi:hypothetical protein